MDNYIVPLIGLGVTMAAHFWFYFKSDTSIARFTGRLKSEENLLLDSMVLVGAIQVSYFLWRTMEALTSLVKEPVLAVLNSLGFVLLAGLIYTLYRLVENSEQIVEKYGVDPSIGDENE